MSDTVYNLMGVGTRVFFRGGGQYALVWQPDRPDLVTCGHGVQQPVEGQHRLIRMIKRPY